MKDRFTRGFVGGLLAGVAMNVWSWLSYSALNWTELRYLDWGAVVMYGHRPTTLEEVLFAQLGQLFFASLMGIGFLLLIPRLTSMNYLVKGWIYGIVVWFSVYAVAIAYKMPSLTRISLDSASSNLIGATIYGLVLAQFARYLDDRLRPRAEIE